MPEPASLAVQLRTATRAAHRALDHHPLLALLVRPGLGGSDYARALGALHGPQVAMESWLADFLPAADLPPRLPDLNADLAELASAPCPLMVARPDWPDTVAARLGGAYVIEGAHLGGAVIARQLPVNLPRRFFGNAGGEVRWQRFWQFASQFDPISPEQLSAAVLAAEACFAWYRAHLDGCLAAQGAVSPTSGCLSQ